MRPTTKNGSRLGAVLISKSGRTKCYYAKLTTNSHLAHTVHKKVEAYIEALLDTFNTANFVIFLCINSKKSDNQASSKRRMIRTIKTCLSLPSFWKTRPLTNGNIVTEKIWFLLSQFIFCCIRTNLCNSDPLSAHYGFYGEFILTQPLI